MNTEINALGGDDPLIDTKERIFFRLASMEKQLQETNDLLKQRSQKGLARSIIYALKHAFGVFFAEVEKAIKE